MCLPVNVLVKIAIGKIASLLLVVWICISEEIFHRDTELNITQRAWSGQRDW